MAYNDERLMELDEKLSLMLRTSHKSRPERDLINPVWSFYTRTDTDCEENNPDTESEAELHIEASSLDSPASSPLHSPSSSYHSPMGSPMEPPQGAPSPLGGPSPLGSLSPQGGTSPRGGSSPKGSPSPQGGPSAQDGPSPQGSPSSQGSASPQGLQSPQCNLPTSPHSGPPSATASRISSSPTEPMENEREETKEQAVSSSPIKQRQQERKHPKLRKPAESGVTEVWSTSDEDISSEDNEGLTPKSRLPEGPSYKRRHHRSLINETVSPKQLHLQNRRSLFSRTDIKNLVAGINRNYTFRGSKRDWSMIRRKHDLMHISCMSLKDKWRNLTKYDHVKQTSDGQWILQMD
uniref:Uncharacterized protein n=1 Tax=Amphimedon queenslandica TaxID=400682 RepID=A0A1X7T3C8_AMPQE